MTSQGYPHLQKSSKKRYQELPASGRPSQSHTSSHSFALLAVYPDGKLFESWMGKSFSRPRDNPYCVVDRNYCLAIVNVGSTAPAGGRWEPTAA